MRRFFPGTIAALFLFSAASFFCNPAVSEQVSLKIGRYTALGDLKLAERKTLKDGVLVLTHGTLAHKDMELIKNLQSALYDRGVSTLSHTLTLGIDQRKGMYDCEITHTHKHEDAVREIKLWIDWLKQKGAENVSLLGHSRAGNQVVLFTSSYSQEIKKLILLAPSNIESFERGLTAYKDRFGRDINPFLKEARKYEKDKKKDKILTLPGFIYCANARVSVASFLSYYGDRLKFDTRAYIKKLSNNILIIAGAKDTVVPDVARHFESVATKPNITVETIADADHMFLDFYTEDVADKIEEFLSVR